MKRLHFRYIFCIILIFSLVACGSEQSSSSSNGGYKETKSMVIDILKTEEGKKAIYEALTASGSQGSSGGSSDSEDSDSESGSEGGGGNSGGSFGIKMIMPNQSSEQVRMAVKDTLTSPEYKKELEKIMTDPQFAGDFAKAISSESKQLHMDLIKDPTYQKSVNDMLKSPEIMKMFLDLTKTTDFRKQSMAVMHEAMQSPIFKMQVMELLKTVVQQQLEPNVEKSGGEKSGEEKGGSEGSGDESKKQEDEAGGGGE